MKAVKNVNYVKNVHNAQNVHNVSFVHNVHNVLNAQAAQPTPKRELPQAQAFLCSRGFVIPV